jgi:glutathione synthase/RimK-type ligase-like ATP-grasp enzyme
MPPRLRLNIGASVLVIGSRADSVVEAVTDALEQRCVRWCLCDQEAASDRGAVSLRIEPDTSAGGTIRSGACSLQLAELTSVWWWRERSLPPSTSEEWTAGPSDEAAFARREWSVLLESLPELAGDALWVNDRRAQKRAERKPYQLALAMQAGFAIPPTLVTNDPSAAKSFLTRFGGGIYKPLSWFYAPPDTILYTNVVSADDVIANERSLELAPGIFQARVEKAHELRVTIVGDRVFAAKVDSQSRLDTAIDWRRNSLEVSYDPVELDRMLEHNLLRMQAQLGLAFGAYDLIVTPEGETVFLEVNPSGQWLWIERATGLAITDALVDLLTTSRVAPVIPSLR